MGVRREVEEGYDYGLWNEIFLDSGNVETMSFFIYYHYSQSGPI